jgi:hypothetical protein
MQYKTFGNTGLLVSTLCLGTMTLRAMPKRAIQPEKRGATQNPSLSLSRSGGGRSRDRHPGSARDTEPSSEGLRRVELKNHPLWIWNARIRCPI